MTKGKVYLVGAGPGDPGLITVKGLDCLKRADVIVYDRLIDDSLLKSARPDAEKIYVGKSGRYHSLEQKEINKLLVKKAQEGKTVVRLKGGDPFVLGRGGEEAETLTENNISFEIVSGVSSAVAVPAYAGIPVTHRRVASSFAVVTGHEDAGKKKSSIAWDKVANGADTLVCLMGVNNLAQIVSQLIKNGRTETTPVAVIHQGTTRQQRTITGTLADIVAKAKEQNIAPPAVIVVGEVVRLRSKLNWFEQSPLAGKRILVTRAREQASELSQQLSERGALPIEMPVIKISPPASWKKLDQAILNLKKYHWVIFTSVNGVETFFQRVHALGLDSKSFRRIKIGVIGSATAKALNEYGLSPDYIPETYTSQGFLAGFGRYDISGHKVLLPRADIASQELADGINRLGGETHEVVAYRTRAAKANTKGRQMLLNGEIDVVTFASSSTVTNLLNIMGTEWPAINQARIACIGPKTAATAIEAGLRVDIEAKTHTIRGLVEAVETYFQEKGGEV
ncbi:MAG: uroporphyrinogen-III C-methyltransferase [Chloroflexota bacterium]